jgi:hypothetical protein
MYDINRYSRDFSCKSIRFTFINTHEYFVCTDTQSRKRDYMEGLQLVIELN